MAELLLELTAARNRYAHYDEFHQATLRYLQEHHTLTVEEGFCSVSYPEIPDVRCGRVLRELAEKGPRRLR